MKYNHRDIENEFKYHTKGTKQSPEVHSSPEFHHLRKIFQGINATTKGSLTKSIRRHQVKENAKQKALSKYKQKI